MSYTEDALFEQPSIALLNTLGWQRINAYHKPLRPEGQRLVSGELDVSTIELPA